MNTFVVSKPFGLGKVVVQAVNGDYSKLRDLNEKEMEALEGLLNEQEFEQHIDQNPF